jgi:chromate transport protein ChrA
MNKEKKVEEGFCNFRCSDKLDSIGWALGFIWGGIVLLAEVTGYATQYSWWDGWGVFFTGAGIIVLIEIVVRLFKTEIRNPSLWDLVFACFLLAIGLGDKVGWTWPLILFIIGFIILRSALKDKF